MSIKPTIPDNPEIEVVKAGKTGLFTNYIFNAIPLAFDESMSYYETLCGLLNYLQNTIIPTVNNNADAVAELQTLYEELKTFVDDYFTNLDVQEEINNKLDTMASDGTLDQLLLPYFNAYKNEINADMTNYKNNINADMTNYKNNINHNIDAMNTKIDAQTSGSPLVASSTSEMTDRTRIYVNTSDGNWYYYDGSEWVIGGVYQSRGIDNNTIETAMIKDYAITYDKFGDFNLKAIEDYFIGNNSFTINTQKIADSTSTNLQKGRLTNYSGGYGVVAVGVPFVYNDSKQYRYLIIPQLEILNSGYLHIAITEEPTGQIQSLSSIIETKRYFEPGTYTNVVIPLYELNYSELTSGTTYYICLYQLSTENNVTYNSLYSFNMTNTQSPNTPSSFIYNLNAIAIIQSYGAWSWIKISNTSFPTLTPAFGLSIENPLDFTLGISPDSFNKLNNKVINFMGDSITQGVDGNTNGNVAQYPYPLIISNKTNAICNNYGIAGSTIGGDGRTVSAITGAIQGYLPMVDRIKNMNKNADINIIFGGTNDALADRRVNLGNINDTTNLTFYGALNNICEYLLTTYPTKTNLLITPFKRNGQQNPNQYGYKLEDYVNAVVQVGKKFGIPVFNFFDNMGGTMFNTNWRVANLPDGTHPSQDYYYIVADKIINFISENI